MNKTEIFHNAFMQALKNRLDVKNEMDGFEDENDTYSFRTVLHEMIRQQVQDIIYHMYYEDDDDAYDEWCDGPCEDMYDDLWKWIDAGMPFGCEDDALEFSETEWHKK